MKRQLLLFVMGTVAVLAFMEALFRILPGPTATRSGYYIHPLILTYPASHCFTVATGWDLKNSQYNCANNLGFLADRDFVYDPRAIALIGDSFVEANMLPSHKRLATQLEAKLVDTPVYSFGGPGSSLLDYAERAKFSAEKFGTRSFVFILSRADVREAVCGSGNIHGPCIDAQTLLPRIEIQSPPSLFKRFLRESSLAQYIFSQLRFDISKIVGNFFPKESKEKTGSNQALPLLASQQVVFNFFKQLSTITNAQFIFLIDADRAHLSDQLATESNELKFFKSAAHAIHATVLDPTSLFREYVETSGQILEIGPYDGHWNGDAIQLVAELITKNLFGISILDPTRVMETKISR
jgi:hypothetical protein